MRTSPQMTYTHVIPSPLPVMRTSIPRYTSVADQPRSIAQHITLPTLLIPESGSSSKVSHPASPSSHPHLKLLNNGRPLTTPPPSHNPSVPPVFAAPSASPSPTQSSSRAHAATCATAPTAAKSQGPTFLPTWQSKKRKSKSWTKVAR
jgi:hypothetical protein